MPISRRVRFLPGALSVVVESAEADRPVVAAAATGAVRAPGSPRLVSQSAVGYPLGLLALLAVTSSAAGLGHVPAFETFALIFSSIVIEALPFILLGALVSAALAVFVSASLFARIARLPLAVQLPGAALGGFAFPVCECGSVPVARRLISKGVHPAAGVAFMLASPILNPLVLGSTWVAYGGGTVGGEMVAGRALLGLVTAAAVGLVIGRSAGGVLRSRPDEEEHPFTENVEPSGRGSVFADHVVSDFLFMGKFIVLGAALSALLQTAVPESVLAALGGTAVLSAVTLMAVAFVLSLCSEADAFIAASFTGFAPSAQLAFLVFGPIADTKLAVLYGATFRRWFVLRLILTAAPIVVAGSLLFEALIR
jgi:uncharacterized protein